MTKSDDALLGDVAVYAAAAAVGQCVSHWVLANDPKLPASWEQLIARYAAGSGIVAAACSVYALRHPGATARDGAIVQWGILLGCGGAVALLHLGDHLRARAAADAADAAYDQQEHGHDASPPRRPLPLPRRWGA